MGRATSTSAAPAGRSAPLVALVLALAGPAHAQDVAGRHSVLGRDGGGPYRGEATVTSAADGGVEVVLTAARERFAGGAWAPTGATVTARVEGRLVEGGRVLVGRRRATPGIAGAVGGAAPGEVEVRYRVEPLAGGRARLVREGGPDEVLEPWAGPAEDRPGDWGRPLEVDRFPFVHAATTAGRRGVVDCYAARPQALEGGPEVVYRVRVERPSRLTAWVEGDDGRVDVDVHLLSGLDLDADGLAPRAVARDDRALARDVAPGTWFVVVDTFTGGAAAPAARAGAYRLRLDLAPDDAWYERPVARGVRLRTKRYPALFGAPQSGAVLDVDPAAPGVVVKPVLGAGCATTSRRAREAGAVAAINGGFFGPGCASVSLVKVDGALRATNAKPRTALGLDRDGRPRLALVEAGRDWPEVTHALGGVPRVLAGGAVVVRPGDEGSAASFTTGRHPRTAVGITASGGLVLATADGRSAAGAGMTLPELGQWLLWLGCREGLNLDGGGSTALWVRGEPWGGVVNHPSDGAGGAAGGRGTERPVSSILAVFADPLDEDARWLVPPPAALAPGSDGGACEVVAVDPEGAAIALALGPLPSGVAPDRALLLDRGDGTGRLIWRGPPPASPVRLELIAAVAGSRALRQAVVVSP